MKRGRTIFCCMILLATAGIAHSQGNGSLSSESASKSRAQDVTFHSVSLNRNMHYLILLPRGYDKDGKFPVLYLLHGLYGDYKNWDTRTQLERDAESLPLMIVMPDADDSWYTNSTTNPVDKFEDYIAKDLISEIDSKYPTIPNKSGRAIAGLSMGGYGAIKFALKYPDLFALAGSLSGALNAAQDLGDLRPEFRARLLEVFGPVENSTRPRNDIFQLLMSSHDYPDFYLACGEGDFFLDTNRAFTAQLSKLKARYEYRETPGGHIWEYWDRELVPLLHAVSHALGLAAAKN